MKTIRSISILSILLRIALLTSLSWLWFDKCGSCLQQCEASQSSHGARLVSLSADNVGTNNDLVGLIELWSGTACRDL